MLDTKESFNKEKFLSEPIPDCVSHNIDGKIQYAFANEQIKKLDEIPSPYTTGLMDKFFDGRLNPIIQTSRGCPFRCTFCADGTDMVNQVNKFSQDYFSQLISERSGTQVINIKDQNDLKNFFDDNGKTFSFKQGEIIYKEGQHSNYIYLIEKGLVKCHKLDDQGKDLTTALHKEDDLFGYTSFTENTTYKETAAAIKESVLLGISKNQFIEIISSNHKVTLDLIQLLNDDLVNVKDQLLEMAYSSVKKRTALTILKFADKLGSKPTDFIRISRNDLASVAGVATESLIRTLSRFRDDGIIEIEGRNIKVLDLQELKNIE